MKNIIGYTPKNPAHARKGWHEPADHTGKAPKHVAASTKATRTDVLRSPMVIKTLTLYHGTCEENANQLVNNGWSSSEGHTGGNVGRKEYLYLSSGKEDALWFAEEKGCSSIVTVSDIPISYLEPDPEDGGGYSLDELIHLMKTTIYPSKFILTKPLGKEHFKHISDIEDA